MYRKIAILSLVLAACSSQHEEILFDKKYESPCEAFQDISQYALKIHINKESSQYDELRQQSSQKMAKAIEYTGSIPATDQCEDIESFAKFETKKSLMQVYSQALFYFMQSMDPHSMYIPEIGATDMKKQDKNIAYGIGIEPKYIHRAIKAAMPIDTVLLDYVYPDTPAFGKLQPEDEIETINGEEICGKTFSEVSKLIATSAKSIEIKVKRLGEPFIFKPSEYQKPSMYVKPIAKNGSLIRIPRFVDGVASELKEKLEQLNQKGSQGLILDLRGNPGGLVDEGVATLKLLIQREGEIFHTEGSDKKNSISKEFHRQVYHVNGQALYTKPIVVLVDSDTASIAEAVAGTLKNKNRAVVIGNKTFGKGSVQIDQNISAKNGFGGILITTVSLLYYPDENTHQIKGVTPDYQFIDDKFENALQIVKQKNISSVFYEKEYDNTIAPHGNASAITTSDQSGSMTDVGNISNLSHTCDQITYQACLETYATKFLEALNHKKSI